MFVLLAFYWGATAFAGDTQYPLAVSGGSHSLTVPWHTGPVTKRFNPAIFVGSEHTLRSWGGWRLYQTANLGYFQHYWWMTGILVDTELGIGRELPLGLNADIRLGVGYLHYFWRRKTYELEDGEWVEATNWGKPSAIVPLSMILGYRGISAGSVMISPFVSVQWAVQLLLIDESDVMTHEFILVGARMSWGRKAQTEGRR
jgi:hypothetical protein